MLQLLVPDPDSAVKGGDGFREESAYAPYMNVLPHAIGPKVCALFAFQTN
jgi:hypothetical protein